MVLIKTVSLFKLYGKDESLVTALQNINFEINAGDYISIVGTSGSGKTTLLHMLSGLDNPTSGSVIYKNENISTAGPDELARYRSAHVGFVFQFFNLIPILSVEENIRLPLMINGTNADEAYLNMLIDMLGLKAKLHTAVSKLSGGQQQRVAIARALSHKPDLLFADEPTGALDSKTSNDIMNIFDHASKELQQTIVLVTHDPIVASHSKRIIELEDGCIVNDRRQEGIT